MGISRQQTSVWIIIDHKTTGEWWIFQWSE